MTDRKLPPPPQSVSAHWSNDPNEPITSPGMKIVVEPGSTKVAATPEYVNTKQSEATTQITKYVASADVKWFVASMAAVAIASVVLVGWFDGRAAEKDAGVAKVAADALEEHKKAEAAAMAELKVTVERNRQEAAQAARDQGQKLDAILFRFGVPNPAPTATDGGR